MVAGVAQWQSSGFVNRRSRVRIPSPAPARGIIRGPGSWESVHVDAEKPVGVELESLSPTAGVPATDRPVGREAKDGVPRNDPRQALRAERWLAEENRVIAEIGRIVASDLHIEQVYQRFAEEVGRLIPFDRLAIGLTNALIDVPENTNKVAYSAGLMAHRQPGDLVPLEGSVVSAAIHSRSTQIFSTECEEVVARLFPGNLPAFRAGIRTLLVVPPHPRRPGRRQPQLHLHQRRRLRGGARPHGEQRGRPHHRGHRQRPPLRQAGGEGPGTPGVGGDRAHPRLQPGHRRGVRGVRPGGPQAHLLRQAGHHPHRRACGRGRGLLPQGLRHRPPGVPTPG